MYVAGNGCGCSPGLSGMGQDEGFVSSPGGSPSWQQIINEIEQVVLGRPSPTTAPIYQPPLPGYPSTYPPTTPATQPNLFGVTDWTPWIIGGLVLFLIVRK